MTTQPTPLQVDGHHMPKARILFSSCLLGVTVLPIMLVLGSPYFVPMAWGVDFFLAVASAHVFATLYLLTDRVNLRFMADHPFQMIAIPLLLIAICIAVFMVPGNPLFVPALMLFLLYQTWHFGAQNIGVAMFVSLSEREVPIDAHEKAIIRIGTICGMVGVLSALYPNFMIGSQHVPIDEMFLRVLRWGYRIGAVAAVGITAWAFFLLLKNWRQKQFVFGIAIFLSAVFLFPMYISNNYMVAVASFTIAHGLQYVIFLAAHSFSPFSSVDRRQRRYSALLLPPIVLLAIIGIGHLIWTRAPMIDSGKFPLVGLSILLGLTLAHFWVDQFMWKMRNPDRARWIKGNYGFVFKSR
jgi:hypothetical protein